jgi:hypothetical protein
VLYLKKVNYPEVVSLKVVKVFDKGIKFAPLVKDQKLVGMVGMGTCNTFVQFHLIIET